MNRISVCIRSATFNRRTEPLARACPPSLGKVADEVVVVDVRQYRPHRSRNRPPTWRSGFSLAPGRTTRSKEFLPPANKQPMNGFFSMDADEEMSSLLHTLSAGLEETQAYSASVMFTKYREKRGIWGAWIKHSGWYSRFSARRLYRRASRWFSAIIRHQSRIAAIRRP